MSMYRRIAGGIGLLVGGIALVTVVNATDATATPTPTPTHVPDTTTTSARTVASPANATTPSVDISPTAMPPITSPVARSSTVAPRTTSSPSAIPSAENLADAAFTDVAIDTIKRLSLDWADTTKVVTFDREVFQYTAGGRRDPFVSLLTSDEIRPLLTDLRLTTIAYDSHGRNSVAVLRDIGTKAQYRVKVGSPLGRMRVVRIDPKAVTFVIEEFGYSRQETLAMGDSTNTRKP